VLNQGRIGGPQSLGEDRIVIVKVREHRKPRPKSLAEVRDTVVAKLLAERGTAAALAAAEQGAKQLGGAVTIESLAAGWGVKPESPRFVGRGDPSVPAALREAVFAAGKPTATPVAHTVKLDDGSVALFQVSQVRVGASANPELERQLATFLQQRSAAGDLVAYFDEVRRRAKVEKSTKVFGE
jgi:peptidyl-prolyl cis-trans isomerase D